jgi:hypothetical protein
MAKISINIDTDELSSYGLTSDNSFYDELWKVRKLIKDNTEVHKIYDSTNDLSVFLFDYKGNKIGHITKVK